ncbi:MAG: DNA-directed DNA polymerase [Methanocalculus sp.]|uniref:DNA-directed DNA polymerase n=1 Tax=Methanocalculus sp. TaxID=2004547 RepID=UPI00271C428B|nr:DNA-directed DNA polymerase [Methanocalculus sp.]MDO9539057.1 DNA-directed DNA polymerase [Methanocalculus sp.]
MSGHEIAVIQVEYSNAPGGPLIHIFGRKKDGCAVAVDVTGFRPYFYVPVEEADRGHHPDTIEVSDIRSKTIKGEEVVRLYTKRPTDVREVRERYHHYEADIPFATRFMIDCGVTGGVIVPDTTVGYTQIRPADVEAPARVCFLDIECDDSEGFPEPEKQPIFCITCHDSFDSRYTTFLLASSESLTDPDAEVKNGGYKNGCFSEGKHTICTYPDERSMLLAFIAHIKKTNPDIISGWNVLDFDVPYIMKRISTLGLNPTDLSRIPGQTERNAIRGRVIFDLLAAYKKMQGSQKESYRLDAIAEDELGERKVRYTGTVSDLWKKDPVKLIEYNYKDVELCVGIDAKNTIIRFYQEIARYVGCPLDRTLNSSNVIDIYILRKAAGNFVLPSKGNAVADEFEGATVFEPATGLRENVIVLDLKSLYPMAMMTLNASPETKDPEGEIRAPNGIRFRRSPDGLTRSIIAELLQERDEKKRIRNTFEYGSNDYILYDLQQNVLKVIMNTYYGVSGYARFRLYDREIGSAVTSVGRAIIGHTRDLIAGKGYDVLYGDTDSCFVQLPPNDIETTIQIAREIEGELNASFGSFARDSLNADTNYFSIKFEKVYRRFFQAGKKKRYAGHLIWKEGSTVDQIDIVGFEMRRSDSPQITKIVQKTVMEMILMGEDFDSIKEYLGEVIKHYRAGRCSLEDAGIPGGIGKHLADYDTKDAQVRGAIYSNTYLKTDFKKGSKPKRVYIKNVTSTYPKTDVICFEYADQVPPEFVIDWETMLEKTVKGPISRILEGLLWDWSDIDPQNTTLAMFGIS